jgi:nitrate reductase beta subunit
MPDVRSLRIPVRYLANLLTAGKEEPVAISALERMLAMRGYMRSKTVDGVIDDVDGRPRRLSAEHDRGHVPAHGDRQLRGPLRHSDSHREVGEDAYDERGSCGFSFGNGCSGGTSDADLFGAKRRKVVQTPTDLFKEHV